MEELEPEPIIPPFLVLSSFCRNAPASPRSLQVSLQFKAREATPLRSVLSGLQPPPRPSPKAQLAPATGRSKLSPGALKRRFPTTSRRSLGWPSTTHAGQRTPSVKEAVDSDNERGRLASNETFRTLLRTSYYFLIPSSPCSNLSGRWEMLPRISPPQKLKNN
jgi:hypothetical protein